MRTARPDQLWAIGGALGAVLLLALGWFFLIGPQNDETDELDAQISAAHQRVTSLQRRLVELKQQSGNLEQYRAQLVRDRQALPSAPALADFLRELNAAVTITGVTVNGLVVGSSVQVTAAGAKLFALPITLTVNGRVEQADAFVDQLQRVQPRAALVSGASVVPDDQGDSLTGVVTLSLNVQVFVAPPAGTGAEQSADPAAQGGGAATGSGSGGGQEAAPVG